MTETQMQVKNDGCLIFILLFFLGTLGIHRIVAGKTASGVLMLFVGLICDTLAFVTIGISLIPIIIWLLIDLILILFGNFSYKTITVKQ